MPTSWTQAHARHTYSIPHWSEGYVDVDDRGRLTVRPQGETGPSIILAEVIAQAQEQGLRLPILVRFADILGDKLRRLQAAFAGAMKAHDYAGGYTAIYPIKVNQHHGVASELVASGNEGFGLEAGSKPELVAVLALSRGGTVICNGYKDREYIRLALIGRKLGLNIFIVIEKPSELKLVIEESKALGVAPLLGVRMRLATIGAGKWQNTGGDKAKFGLNPRQVLDLVGELKAAGLTDALKLLHFHMGSQMSNVRDIAGGMREAVRYFVELSRLGHRIQYMDVGGGLGIDYEGTRSRSFCSINYSLDQYAATVVAPIAEACAAHGLEPPRILTEAGRAMTAHHAVLVVNVSEVEQAPLGSNAASASDSDATAVRHLREIFADLDRRPPLELFHEAQHYLAEGQALYALGNLDLSQRAELDDLYYAIANGVKSRLRGSERSQRVALDELHDKLVDKYFVNFSVFQSVPDVWAIDQVFPIVPITRLNEAPTRNGVIADLTCDSDGRIDQYVDSEGVDTSLPLHELKPGEPYRLGIFLVGAYQETLGDNHNLFGDTDSVGVHLRKDGYELTSLHRGDSTDKLLGYIGYDIDALRRAFSDKINAVKLGAGEGARLQAALEAGLTGYTYLEEASD